MNISDYSPESLDELYNFVDEFFNYKPMTQDQIRDKCKELIVNYFSTVIPIPEAEIRFDIIEVQLLNGGPINAAIEITKHCTELGLNVVPLLNKIKDLRSTI